MEKSMSQAPLNTADRAITGNFNMTAQMPNGRTIAIAGYIYDGESVESLNARMDMLMSCAERQRKKAEIPELQVKIEQLNKAIEQNREAYATLDSRAMTGDRLSSQEKTAMSNYPVNIKHLEEERDRGLREIAAAELEVA